MDLGVLIQLLINRAARSNDGRSLRFSFQHCSISSCTALGQSCDENKNTFHFFYYFTISFHEAFSSPRIRIQFGYKLARLNMAVDRLVRAY